MRKTFLGILAFVSGAFAGVALSAEHGASISIGERFTLESKVLGETRPYLVHKPNGYDFTKGAYPVLVALDGDDHFQHVVASMELLAQSGRIPQLIVVGVPSLDRVRDLSPPTVDPIFNGSGRVTADGAANFLSFIGDELLPMIERTYRTRPYRVLIGHSQAGMFAAYALLNKPKLFGGYIVISPALQWDNDALVKEMEAYLLSHKEFRADIYLTIANENRRMLESTFRFAGVLAERAPPDLRWQFHRYPDETHGSTSLRSTYDGLQAIFDGWYIHDPFEVFDQGGLAGLEKRYAKISERIGYELKTSEDALVSTSQSLMQRNRFIEAETVLKRAEELYPGSSNVQFTFGNLYATMKDESNAIDHFTKALTLSPGFEFVRRLLANYKVDVSRIAPEIKLPVAKLASYIGTYRTADMSVEVVQRHEALFVVTSLGENEIKPLSETRFYYVDGGGRVNFELDKRGRVARLGLNRAGNDFEFSRSK